MPLVDYSDSESSESPKPQDSQIRRGIKRKHNSTTEPIPLPPLPDSFHDLYASTSRISKQDDPILHGGRQRIMPHIEGNWPTHVYIECRSLLRPFQAFFLNRCSCKGGFPSTQQSSRISDVVNNFGHTQASRKQQVFSLLKSELGAELPLHISLSRPITLLTNQRQTFVDALIQGIDKSSLRP